MDIRLVESVVIEATRDRVFAFVTQPDAPARTFRGHGPVPAAVRAEIEGGGPLRVGAIRKVHNSDGSVVDEEIVALDAPARQAYRLVRGIKAPLSWLVRGAHGDWRLDGDGARTRVTWTFTFVLRVFLFWPVAALVGRAFRKAMAKALAETKRQVEAGPADR
jgi:hypothetical protein